MIILPTKKKWFDMILSGEKKEEYREIKPYYERRLPVHFGYFFINGKLQTGWKFDVNLQQSVEPDHEIKIMFRNGYSKTSPSFIAKCTLSIGTGKEEWGAEKGKQYFILTIHEIEGDSRDRGRIRKD